MANYILHTSLFKAEARNVPSHGRQRCNNTNEGTHDWYMASKNIILQYVQKSEKSWLKKLVEEMDSAISEHKLNPASNIKCSLAFCILRFSILSQVSPSVRIVSCRLKRFKDFSKTLLVSLFNNVSSLNSRNELVSTCRHRRKHLLSNYCILIICSFLAFHWRQKPHVNSIKFPRHYHQTRLSPDECGRLCLAYEKKFVVIKYMKYTKFVFILIFPST